MTQSETPVECFALADGKNARRGCNPAIAHDPTDHDKIEQLRNQRQRQKNNRQSCQHLRAARSAKIKVAIINPDTQQDDLEDAAPALQPKMEEFFDHCSTASVTRNASTFS